MKYDTPAPRPALPLNRRTFLTMVGAGAAAAPLLAGCRTGDATTNPGASSAGPGDVSSVLPSHIPIDYVEPDFPSVNGSTAGYASIPEELVQVFDTPPGSGSTLDRKSVVEGKTYRGGYGGAVDGTGMTD